MYMDNQTIKAWQSDRREPCRAYLSPAYTVRLVEADIGMPGLKDAVLFPSGLIDHVAEAESKPHSLSEAWTTFSFWEKERALLSDDSPESVQHP